MNKQILLTILCFLGVFTLSAQQKNRSEWKNWNTDLSIIELLNKSNQRTILGLTDKDELQILSQNTDEQGIIHIRAQQFYNNIPIEGAHYLIHQHPIKGTAMNGLLIKNLNLKTIPTINEADALNQTLATIKSTKYAWQDQKEELLLQQTTHNEAATYYPKGELMIVGLTPNSNSSTYQLAYRFDIYSIEPMQRYYVYINAHTGQFIKKQSRLYDIEEHSHESMPPVIGMGATRFYGNQNFDVDYDGVLYTMRNTAAELFHGNSSLNLKSTTNNWIDTTANTVHWCLEGTYNYFLNTHGKNSYDGSGSAIPAIVHYGNQWENAAWNGTHLLFGDGNAMPYISADIVAHEWVHGLIEHTANLTYQGESGALNEAFCDIFGVIVEDQIDTNDWIMGQELGGLRNVSNPNAFGQPDTYKGNHWYQGIFDNGGVHTNSGVLNYWFYLLAQGGNGTNDFGLNYNISGIGMANAADIVYKTLHDYLTPNANYADARIATLQATENIYGSNSTEYQTVMAVWCAVGIGTSTNVEFTFSDTLLTVAFLPNVIDSFSTYTWDFGDGNISNQITPTHTYTSDSAYDVQLIVNDACGNADTSQQLVIATSSTSSLAKDSLMLVKLYNDLGGASNPNISWSLNDPMNTWNGLQVTDSILTHLDLSNMNISHIPNLNLPDLTHLHLNNNQLTAIPNFNLPNLLYLALAHNQLTEIPGFDLPNLRYLYLNNNQLSVIPNFNLPNLRYLYLPNNQLVDIPSLNRCPLDVLHLQNNQLNFDDLSANHFDNMIYGYKSQDSLTTYQTNHLLYVEAGNQVNNTYKWFRNNVLVATVIGDSTFLVTSIGNYRCEVTNSTFTQNRFFQDLTLYSKAFEIEDCSINDSTQLVQLYTVTNGQNWNNSWAINQPITTYQGVYFNPSDCGIDSLDIRHQNVQGNIPNLFLHSLRKLQADQNNITGLANFQYLDSLNYLSITNNQLSDLPNNSHLPELDTFYVQNNQLVFDDLLPYQTINVFQYAPQDSFTLTQLGDKLIADIGDVENNTYDWYKNNTLIATINGDSIFPITNTGYYRVKVKNSILTDLDLWSTTFFVDAICNADFSPSQTNTCEGSTLSFTNQSNNASTYEWRIDNLLMANTFNFNYTFNTVGTYEVTLTTFSGNCQVSYSNNIIVYPNANNQLAPADTSICGQPFSKSLIARDGMSSYQWTDENGLTLSHSRTCIATQYDVYTIASTDFCGNANTETVKIEQEEDCYVWAGDCNDDGTVNETDWLAWGLMFGDTGVARVSQDIIWEGKTCPDWQNVFNNINYKHGDANGNGVINFIDTAAIITNWGKNTPNYDAYKYDWDGNLWRTTTKIIHIDTLQNNKLKVTLGIYLKDKNNSNNPINIHGFSANIKTKTSALQYFGGNYNLSDSWLGVKDEDLYAMQTNSSNLSTNIHEYHLAITRRDRKNKNGIGILGKVDFIIEEPTVGNDTLKLRFFTNNTKISRGQGSITSLRPTYTALFMIQGTNFTKNIPIEINASSASCSEGGTATIRPIPVGSSSTTYTYLWSNGDTSQTITGLDTGRYYVTVTDAFGNTGNGYAEIEGFSALTVIDTITPASVGQADGAVQLGIHGGSGYYSIQWENEDTTALRTNLAAGIYLVTVTDDTLGCSVIHPVEVYESAVLPVELCCFNASLLDHQVKLEWKTLSELKNSHFNIQKSSSGIDFETIGQVNGHGTTQQERGYGFLDNAPFTGINYYRLQQVDYDNEWEYSNVISIEINSSVTTIKIYPNPVKEELTIDLGNYGTPQSIEIWNTQGQLIRTIIDFKNTILVSDLTTGMYFLVIDNQVFIKWIKL